MRLSKKVGCNLLALLIVGGVAVPAAGCRKQNGVEIDSTKTQLHLSNYDAGGGRKWVDETIKAFEEDMKNYSFEEGKKGVQVIPNHNRTNVGNGTFYEGITSSSANIFFTEGNDYQMFAHGNKLYDITEVLSQGAITGADENGNLIREQTPIKDKIDDTLLGFLNIGTDSAPAYYAMPYMLSNKGFIYDKDLWNEQRFYFAKNGCPSEYVVEAKLASGNMTTAKNNYYADLKKSYDEAYIMVDASGVDAKGNKRGLSAGPDGKYGTLDDGLPATYEEFYDLMDKMVGSNITPMIWTGKNTAYADMITTGLWQNDAGVDELKTFYSLTGEMEKLVVFENGEIKRDEQGNIVTESKTFDGGQNDGYEVQRSITKYNALQFADKIANNPSWTHSSCFDSTSQIQAQTNYLTSVTKGKRIAMLIDGAWWLQEASDTFSIMESEFGSQYSKDNRDFGMLTLPNSSVERYIEKLETGEKYTVVSQNESFCFVNGNLSADSPQLKAALAFLSYMSSDKGLAIYTKASGTLRPLKTTFTEEQKAGFNKYTRNILEYIESANLIYPYSDSTFVNDNKTYIDNTYQGWLWHTYVNQIGEYYYPVSTLANTELRKSGLTAEKYFVGMYNYYKDTMWPKLKK